MTNTELAILGLIVEAPRHGYEIEQIIEMRGMRDWTDIGFSSIYYLLNKLEKKGLISSNLQTETGQGPARKIYSPTTEGQEEWQKASLDLLCGGQQTTPFLLGLAAIPGLKSEEVQSALQENLAGLRERKAHMLERWEAQKPISLYIEAMFTYSLALMEAEEKWLKEMIGAME